MDLLIPINKEIPNNAEDNLDSIDVQTSATLDLERLKNTCCLKIEDQLTTRHKWQINYQSRFTYFLRSFYQKTYKIHFIRRHTKFILSEDIQNSFYQKTYKIHFIRRHTKFILSEDIQNSFYQKTYKIHFIRRHTKFILSEDIQNSFYQKTYKIHFIRRHSSSL